MKIIPAVLANLFTLLLLTACGGGGGGVTTITGNAGLGGTVTNGVSITAANARNVAAAVLNGVAAGTGSSDGAGSAPPLITGVAVNASGGSFNLPGMLLDQLASIPGLQIAPNNTGIVGAGIGLNEACAISGSATLLPATNLQNFNELNIGDTLAVSFFLCNEIGVVLDGTISIFVANIAGGGPYDPNDPMGFNITLDVTYTGLRALDGSDYYYWDGVMQLVLDDDGAGNITTVMSGTSLDTSYNNQYPLSTAYHDQLLTDYLFDLFEDNAGTYTIDLDGTVESLDIDGTVTFTTTDIIIDPTVAAFTGNDSLADNPTAGVLLVQSTEPLATGSQLRLTADMNGVDVMIEVDSNGDGFYEPPSVMTTWAALEAL